MKGTLKARAEVQQQNIPKIDLVCPKCKSTKRPAAGGGFVCPKCKD